MKREIKFRAWDLYQEKMVEQPYLFSPWADYNGFSELKPSFIYHEDWSDCEDGISRPCHIMQFTGLKDKNGKEIYEGDIIKVPDEWSDYGMMAGEKRQVVFASGGFRFKSGNPKFRGHWLEDDGEFEIIGNIYENPDLLT